HPPAAQHQRVHPAVVVVVGLDEVQAARLAQQAGGGGAVLEGAVAPVVEQPHLVVEADGRGHEVEVPVVVEVVEDGAAGEAQHVQAGGAGHVGEAGQRGLGGEGGGRDQERRRHLVGIAAERHL